MNKVQAQQTINEWFAQKSQGDEILIIFSADQTTAFIAEEGV